MQIPEQSRNSQVQAGAAGTTAAEFTVPVPSLMRPVTARMLGRQVALDDLVGLPIQTRITVARYRQRSYARFTVPDELAQRFAREVAALESDLLAGSTPPLTLDAAVALARARRGDLAAAGGEIIGIYLEPLVTRFATLSEAGRTLIPLGRLANEPGTAVALRQVIVQFEIKPAWVQHECFFLEAK